MARTVATTINPSALDFDGDGSYVSNLSSILPTSGDITISFWYKVPSGTNMTGRYVFDAWRDYFLSCPLGNWGFRWRGDGSKSYLHTGITVPIDGEWHHKCLVGFIDGTPKMIDYTDGQPSPVKTATSDHALQNNADFSFGRLAGSTTTSFQFIGTQDQVRIWNRALTITEVAQDYDGARVVDGLIGEWLFNEGAGTTAYDTAGGNHGTITGATYVTEGIKSWYRQPSTTRTASSARSAASARTAVS
jgi:hypothetical protein